MAGFRSKLKEIKRILDEQLVIDEEVLLNNLVNDFNKKYLDSGKLELEFINEDDFKLCRVVIKLPDGREKYTYFVRVKNLLVALIVFESFRRGVALKGMKLPEADFYEYVEGSIPLTEASVGRIMEEIFLDQFYYIAQDILNELGM